jgi:hypothetical protein
MHPAQGIVVLWTLSNLKILEKLTSVQIGVLFGAFSSEVVVNCPVFTCSLIAVLILLE